MESSGCTGKPVRSYFAGRGNGWFNGVIISRQAESKSGKSIFKARYEDGDEEEHDEEEFKSAQGHFEAKTEMPPALNAALSAGTPAT